MWRYPKKHLPPVAPGIGGLINTWIVLPGCVINQMAPQGVSVPEIHSHAWQNHCSWFSLAVLVRNAFFVVLLFFEEICFFFEFFFQKILLFFFLKAKILKHFFSWRLRFLRFFALKVKISKVFCLESQDCRPTLPVFLGNRFHIPYLCDLCKNAYKILCNHFYTVSYKNTVFLLSHSLSVFLVSYNPKLVQMCFFCSIFGKYFGFFFPPYEDCTGHLIDSG